jgi:putative MATE family efflux protein
VSEANGQRARYSERAAPSTPEPAERTTTSLVLTLAWPVLLQNWLVVAVTFSDRLLAGLTEQTAAQAAQTTAVYLAWMLSSYTVLVTIGSTTLVAHLIGAGDRAKANQVLHQSLLLAVALGVFGSVAGLIFLERGLALLQLHGEAAQLGAAYLRPMFMLLAVQMVGWAGLACLVGAGDTRTSLWVLGGVALFNLPLAWLLSRGAGSWPGLGFPGIAVGTAVSQGVGGLCVLVVLLRGRAGLRLRPGQLRPRLDLLRRLLRVSVPASLDHLSMQIGYLWFLSIVNGLGDVAAAAHGIALTWEALGFQSGGAFGTAAVTVVGQSLGARRPERAMRGGWVAFALGAALMTFMGLLFFTLAMPMFRLFCPSSDQAPIVETGVPVLRLVAFSMTALAACLILAPALRGAGDTRFPILLTWWGFFVVRIPLAYLLTAGRLDLGPVGVIPGWRLGLFGAWLAMFADVQVRGVFFVLRFASGRWRGIRV